ncbi:MAG: hypothetical protein L0Z68_09570 [Gammaproteobacteria bacterium]|nr:hypothetical protein [Gammaproteobacteria bacterium]
MMGRVPRERIARGWVEAIAETYRNPYNGYNGFGGRGIDKMIDQAQGLAQAVPTGMQRHLGALSVRVQVPAGASEAEISGVIGEAIMRSLQK